MTNFIDFPITIDPGELANDATDVLQAAFDVEGIPWAPHATNLEILLIQTLAQMASTTTLAASQVPSAIFRAYGTQIFGIPYEVAVQATLATTWALTDSAGHTIPAGTFVDVAGEGFSVPTDVIVVNGQSTATINVVAADTGAGFNGLGGTVQLVDNLAFVSGVTTSTVSSGGVDAETDAHYQNRLVAELTLQAPRPITAADYAVFVQSFTPVFGTDQELVGRATALDGYSPSPQTFTCTTVNGNPAVTITGGAGGPFSVPDIGATVTGTGIPSTTTVLASPAPTTSGFSMSHNASASNSGVTVTATSATGQLRTMSVFVTDTSGNALNAHTTTAIKTWIAGGVDSNTGVTYPGYREINFVINILPPTYFQISIAWTAHALPGFDATAVILSVNTAINNYINPASWGSATPGALDPTWYSSVLGFSTVRINKIMGVIENVQGIDYVTVGGLAINTTHGIPVATSDILLTGPAPLPRTTYPVYDATLTYVTNDQVSQAGSTYYSIAGNSPQAFTIGNWTLITASPTVVAGLPVSIWGTLV